MKKLSVVLVLAVMLAIGCTNVTHNYHFLESHFKNYFTGLVQDRLATKVVEVYQDCLVSKKYGVEVNAVQKIANTTNVSTAIKNNMNSALGYKLLDEWSHGVLADPFQVKSIYLQSADSLIAKIKREAKKQEVDSGKLLSFYRQQLERVISLVAIRAALPDSANRQIHCAFTSMANKERSVELGWESQENPAVKADSIYLALLTMHGGVYPKRKRFYVFDEALPVFVQKAIDRRLMVNYDKALFETYLWIFADLHGRMK